MVVDELKNKAFVNQEGSMPQPDEDVEGVKDTQKEGKSRMMGGVEIIEESCDDEEKE